MCLYRKRQMGTPEGGAQKGQRPVMKGQRWGGVARRQDIIVWKRHRLLPPAPNLRVDVALPVTSS